MRTQKIIVQKFQNKSGNLCDACQFDDPEEDQINIHKIKYNKFILCFNCDLTIRRKEIMLSKTFDMREVLRKEFPDISCEALDRMVKK